jgi:hypothetical protein
VRNRSAKRDAASVASQATHELHNAPSIQLIKNNFTGENRSAKEKNENTSVPQTNPSMTAVVTRLTAYWLSDKCCFNSGRIALPTNHKDVPANCETTMSGRIWEADLLSGVNFCKCKREM